MQKITIEIEHELTPMHEDLMKKTVTLMMQVEQDRWDTKSAKRFNIKINGKSPNAFYVENWGNDGAYNPFNRLKF